MSSLTGQGPMNRTGSKLPHGFKQYQYQQFTPEAMKLYSSLFPHLEEGGYLSRLAQGDEEIFRQIEAPAHRYFQEQMGQLGSRFSELASGAMSARRGSGFANTSSQAAQDFALQLQAQRQGLTRQALGDLMNYSQMLMGQQPYVTGLYEKPEKQSGWAKWAPLIGGAIGAGVGAAGGPFGAVAGYGAGQAIGGAFS